MRKNTGGFILPPPPLGFGYPGALVPGNGQGPIDVVGGGADHGCAQPLHLTHYDDHRISLSATVEESDWCKGGPVSSTPLYYTIENERRYLAFYEPYNGDDAEAGLPPVPVVELQDAAFFAVNRTDFTILIETSSCGHCNLAGANLAGYNLAGAKLNGANLASANLSGANLSGAAASLQSATLSFAYMPDADLTGADLTGAHLNNVDFYQVAKRPSLNGAALYQTQFANANLIGIDLGGAHLEGADFSGAQMVEALLTGITHVDGSANGRVSFVKTLLAGAQFTNSTFDGGDFTNAIFSTKPGSVDLLVRNSPTTTVTQPYNFGATVRPLSTTRGTVCPDTTSGPCATAAQWVAQNPPIYQGYNDPNDW